MSKSTIQKIIKQIEKEKRLKEKFDLEQDKLYSCAEYIYQKDKKYIKHIITSIILPFPIVALAITIAPFYLAIYIFCWAFFSSALYQILLKDKEIEKITHDLINGNDRL